MRLNEIINRFDQLYPEELKASYDNVGLMVGSPKQEIKRVYLCLDLTREECDMALKEQADLIITHHPLLFHPLKAIIIDQDPGSIIRDLIKKDIALFAMHTNFDSAKMNLYLGEKLGLEKMEVMSEAENCGVVGEVENLPLSSFVSRVKEAMGLNKIEYVGKANPIINKVGLLAGSGSSLMEDAFNHGASLYLTGDLSYSRAIEAKRMGLNILVIPHYVEHLYTEVIKKDLYELDPSLTVITSTLEVNPFIEL